MEINVLMKKKKKKYEHRNRYKRKISEFVMWSVCEWRSFMYFKFIECTDG